MLLTATISGATYLFFGCEVVDNVEELPDFLRSLAFNHVCDGFASDIPMWDGHTGAKRKDVALTGET